MSAATNALWSNGFPIVLASGTLLGWYRCVGPQWRRVGGCVVLSMMYLFSPTIVTSKILWFVLRLVIVQTMRGGRIHHRHRCARHAVNAHALGAFVIASDVGETPTILSPSLPPPATDMMVDHAFFTDPDVFANITSILREAGFRPIDVLGEWDSPGEAGVLLC